MEAVQAKDLYVSSYPEWVREMLPKNPSWAKTFRKKALDEFAQKGFPTSDLESWKHTDLDAFYKLPLSWEDVPHSKCAVSSRLKSMGFETEKAHLLVFVNGRYSKELSSLKPLPKGAKLQPWLEGYDEDFVKTNLGQIVPKTSRSFALLNGAYFTDGLFLQLGEGQVVPEPIHCVFLTINGGQASQTHLRNLVVMGKNSGATVIEHYWGDNLSPYFTDAVTEVSLGSGSHLDHTKVQEESNNAYHVGSLFVRQQERSHLTSRVLSIGGALGRSEVETVLLEKRAQCVLDGLFLGKGHQHLDHRTFIDHLSPWCKSEELYKGVVDGEATSIFDGCVLVRENAQKTDARQSNRNLELSPKAKVYSKPQLLIYADDVKCSHGSATGRLDEEALFYLRSRGIGREAAGRLLVYAFVEEMVDRITPAYLQKSLKYLVGEWMMQGKGGAR